MKTLLRFCLLLAVAQSCTDGALAQSDMPQFTTDDLQKCFWGQWKQTGTNGLILDNLGSWTVIATASSDHVALDLHEDKGTRVAHFVTPTTRLLAHHSIRWKGDIKDQFGNTIQDNLVLISDLPKCRMLTIKHAKIDDSSSIMVLTFARFPNDPTTLEKPINDPAVVQAIMDAMKPSPTAPTPATARSASSGSPVTAAPPPSSRRAASPLTKPQSATSGPNVVVTKTQPAAGNHGVCESAYEIGIRNYENVPVTVTYHIRTVSNSVPTEADHTIVLQAKGTGNDSVYLGCTSGHTISQVSATNATIISKAFAK